LPTSQIFGHGFIKDDFGWIRGARIESADDAAGLLTRNNGFYRPLVSASFALNYAVSGMAPLACGVTNFALLLAGAALLFMVARRLNLPATPSALASALWVFNFHGINMAVLWVSGRTALLLSCAALASTLAVMNGRMMLGGAFCLLAMLSKEEAVVVPFLLACWTAMRSQTQLYPPRRLSSIGPLLAALVIYLVLRLQSGAFWPATAPSYYRLTIQPSILHSSTLTVERHGQRPSSCWLPSPRARGQAWHLLNAEFWRSAPCGLRSATRLRWPSP
jgi:hypothetical protein